MGYHKGHKEFHVLDMQDGWHTLPGYPAGIEEKIIAGELDEKPVPGRFDFRALMFGKQAAQDAPMFFEQLQRERLVALRERAESTL